MKHVLKTKAKYEKTFFQKELKMILNYTFVFHETLKLNRSFTTLENKGSGKAKQIK
jgi:hypothetical protein